MSERRMCFLVGALLSFGSLACSSGELSGVLSNDAAGAELRGTTLSVADGRLGESTTAVLERGRSLEGEAVRLSVTCTRGGATVMTAELAFDSSDLAVIPLDRTPEWSFGDASCDATAWYSDSRSRRRDAAAAAFAVLDLAIADAGSAGDAGEPDPGPDADAGAEPGDAGAPPPPPPPTVDGIWIGAAELAALPTSGAAWNAVLGDARAARGSANVSDQDSDHDVYTLAAALVCARTGEDCAAARASVVEAIGTEEEALTTPRSPAANQWLPIGRNLAAYVIAADVLGLRADGDPTSQGSRVEAWIASFLGRVASEGVEFKPFGSGSNASAQDGFAYSAVAAYLGDAPALERAWDAFRTYACDPTAPDREGIDIDKGIEFGWAHDDANACAVNPLGARKVVPAGLPGAGTERRIDGAIINDMRRGGDYQWPPGYTQYPWVGLEGFVPAALVLHRAGYPAFEVADRAVLRAVEYLWWLGEELGEAPTCDGACWWDYDRATETKHLVNWYYGTTFPYEAPTGRGRTTGYVDWTHP